MRGSAAVIGPKTNRQHTKVSSPLSSSPASPSSSPHSSGSIGNRVTLRSHGGPISPKLNPHDLQGVQLGQLGLDLPLQLLTGFAVFRVLVGDGFELREIVFFVFGAPRQQGAEAI